VIIQRMRKSPPKLGGVAAPLSNYRASNKNGADGVVPRATKSRSAFLKSVGLGTTPSLRLRRLSHLLLDRRATPPDLGGEFYVLRVFGV